MNKNIGKLGEKTRWKKGEKPKNCGRKPDRLKEFKKENSLSSTDIANIVKNVICGHTVEELMEMAKDKTQDALIVGFIRFYLEDLKKGRIFNFDKMLDRGFGKATQVMGGEITLKSYKIIPAPELVEENEQQTN